MEPIGPHRSDWQAASMCAAIMNAMAIQVRSRKRFKVKDFLLEFGETEHNTPSDVPAGPANWQHMKFIAQMFVAQSKAGDKKKRRR